MVGWFFSLMLMVFSSWFGWWIWNGSRPPRVDVELITLSKTQNPQKILFIANTFSSTCKHDDEKVVFQKWETLCEKELFSMLKNKGEIVFFEKVNPTLKISVRQLQFLKGKTWRKKFRFLTWKLLVNVSWNSELFHKEKQGVKKYGVSLKSREELYTTKIHSP